MQISVDGRRRFSGRLLGISGGEILLATDTGEVHLAFNDLAKAKLILTDELIAESRNVDGPRSGPISKDTGH